MELTRFLIVGFTLCFSTFIFAQDLSTYQKVTDPAELKMKIRKSSAAINSLSSDFRQEKHLTMMEEVLVSQGRFLFRKENNVRWEYLEPISYAIIINGDLFTINNDGKISEFNTESNQLFKEINNMIVMAIQGDFVENPDFEASFFEDDQIYLASLKPNDEILKDILATIEIKFSKSNMAVIEVRFIEAGEDFTAIYFHNRESNITIDDAHFKVQ